MTKVELELQISKLEAQLKKLGNECEASQESNKILIRENKNLESKIEEQKFLAQAVEAKDKEIIKLQKEVESTKTESEEFILKEQEKLNKKLNSTESELIKDYEKQIADLKQKHKDEFNKTMEVHILNSNNLKEIVEKRTFQLNQFIGALNGLLKILQGSVDNTITLNDYILEKIKNNT